MLDPAGTSQVERQRWLVREKIRRRVASRGSTVRCKFTRGLATLAEAWASNSAYGVDQAAARAYGSRITQIETSQGRHSEADTYVMARRLLTAVAQSKFDVRIPVYPIRVTLI
jgi:hypothetical protein